MSLAVFPVSRFLNSVVRRVCTHQITAALGYLFLVKRVETLPALLTHLDQIRIFEPFKMVAHGRLVDPAIETIHNVVHAQPFTA